MKKRPHVGIKPVGESLLDPLFGDEPPEKGNVAERGYITEAELADDERVQRSRANQTFFNNDHRDRDNI